MSRLGPAVPRRRRTAPSALVGSRSRPDGVVPTPASAMRPVGAGSTATLGVRETVMNRALPPRAS